MGIDRSERKFARTNRVKLELDEKEKSGSYKKIGDIQGLTSLSLFCVSAGERVPLLLPGRPRFP